MTPEMLVKKNRNQSTQSQKSKASRHNVPPRNPNKRPTQINMERSIGRMTADDMEAIRRAR